jgi:hypothetical protein
MTNVIVKAESNPALRRIRKMGGDYYGTAIDIEEAGSAAG